MARVGSSTFGPSATRRAVTLVVALVVLALVVLGGSLLNAQRATVQPDRTTSVGRTTTVCAVGSVPTGGASASPSPSGSPTPTPGPSASPGASPSGSPSASPSASASASASNDDPSGTVYGVVSPPADTTGPSAGPAPAGTLTGTRLGSTDAGLSVDTQGRGATLAKASSPVLLQADGAMATSSTGAVLGINADGPQTGVLAAPCLSPSTEQWFPGIGSSADDRTELVLSNPDGAQAEVDLKFYGRTGRVVVPGSPGVAVPARSSRSISLTSLVDEQGPLSVSVTATTGRVSAAARRIRAADTKPAGADWEIPAASPALTQVIPAVPGGEGARELVVTNPGSVRASVQVQVLGLQGPYAPVGAETVDVAPESSATVDLAAGLAGTSAGVKVTSDQPVTGAVTATSKRSDAQADIAVQSASVPLVRTGVSAVATNDDLDSDLVLSNGGSTDAQVSFAVLSYEGVVLRTDDILLAANSTATRRLNSPAPSYVVVSAPNATEVVGGVVLTQTDGAVAGLGMIALTSPDVAGRVPAVAFDPEAGR